MKRTLFMLGQTDIESQIVESRTPVQGGTKVTTDLVGVLPILPFVMGDSTIAANSASLLISKDTTMPRANFPLNVFNLVGDPDASSGILHKIQSLIDVIEPARSFNKPSDVFKTSRGDLPTTLADISRCILPRTLHTSAGNFDELRDQCEEFGHWPMIVRASGFHGGNHMVLLKAMSDLEAIRDETWLYTGVYIIEFVDYADEAGLFQKVRVIMIDGVPYPRHSIFSNHWAVHSGSRRLMDVTPELCVREEEFLANFVHEGLAEFSGVFQQLQERIGLDVFGIDFALVDDSILVFEANACMSFVGARLGGDQYHYLDNYVATIRAALKELLVRE